VTPAGELTLNRSDSAVNVRDAFYLDFRTFGPAEGKAQRQCFHLPLVNMTT
jgi:hypothetical protein